MTSSTTTRDVEEGWDVFGIPHGGYLAALVTDAVLELSGAEDVFTVTVHYLRKAEVGPLEVAAARVGGSRRFSTWTATASQDGAATLAVLASVGDRSTASGPDWSAATPWGADAARLTPPATPQDAEAVSGRGGFSPPGIAHRFALQLDLATVGFAMGQVGDEAEIRAVMRTEQPTVLDAIIGCDVTPPAVWNALGMEGWVPTLELTAHVRATPAPGPLRVRATTRHVAGGFLEEDAEVWDSTDRLVVQSRQLAVWTGA